VDKARRNHINGLAEKIRLACKLETPVEIKKAVECLGGTLAYSDHLDYEAQIEKVHDEFNITLKQDSHENRARFSIAHELGHLFLHMGYIIDEEKWNSTNSYTDSVYHRYGYSVEEYEANEFAAAFLMPMDIFIQTAKENYDSGQYNIVNIANTFKVSTEAAANRGRWLGLFSWNK